MATSIYDVSVGSYPEVLLTDLKEGSVDYGTVCPTFVRALGSVCGFGEEPEAQLQAADDAYSVIVSFPDGLRIVSITKERKLAGNRLNTETSVSSPINLANEYDLQATWALLIQVYTAGHSEMLGPISSIMHGEKWTTLHSVSGEQVVSFKHMTSQLYEDIKAGIVRKALFLNSIPLNGQLPQLPRSVKDAVLTAKGHRTGSSDVSTSLDDYNLAAKLKFVFTDEEKAKIPKKQDWFIMPEEGFEIMDEIMNSYDLRNYWLIGKAGTGKTELAKQIAATLGLPYVFVNCGSGFDDAKIRGQFIPNPDAAEAADPALVAYVNSLTDDDYLMESDVIAAKIGAKSPAITDIVSRITEIKTVGAGYRPEFLWQDSAIVYAYSRPCVCEIQEADCIRDPGVLTNFNSILETGEGKFIQLDNGKILKKNPYCIYIFTSNMQYEGCRMINNAVFDRLDPYRLSLPDKKTRVKRIAKRTGFNNMAVLRRMVDVVDKIDEYLTENGLTTGVCGTRSLERWAEALMIWQNRHPGEDIPEDVLERTGARKVLAKTAQPEDELNEVAKQWYGLFAHD